MLELVCHINGCILARFDLTFLIIGEKINNKKQKLGTKENELLVNQDLNELMVIFSGTASRRLSEDGAYWSASAIVENN